MAFRIHDALSAFAFLPDWAAGLIVFFLIVAGACVAQDLVIAFVSKESRKWPPMLRELFVRTRLVTRFAFVILAAGVAMPLVHVNHAVQDGVQRVLSAAVILLIGWCVLTAAGIASERYIGGLKLDASDNLLARKAITQVRILKQAAAVMISLITTGFALMTFDSVREYGISLFASAGVAGIIAGLAARPLFSNLLAGVQLAVTQPIRLEDAVVIQGEWGWVEELTSTYVVVRLWDLRRLIVPLSWLFENPFQNWTRRTANLIGSVYLYVDYTIPVDRVRAKLEEILRQSPLWDGKTANLQVTDARDTVIELRALMSARNSGEAWDLRCFVREKLIAWLQGEYPAALPRQRGELVAPVAATLERPELRAGQQTPRRTSGQEPSILR